MKEHYWLVINLIIIGVAIVVILVNDNIDSFLLWILILAALSTIAEIIYMLIKQKRKESKKEKESEVEEE